MISLFSGLYCWGGCCYCCWQQLLAAGSAALSLLQAGLHCGWSPKSWLACPEDGCGNRLGTARQFLEQSKGLLEIHTPSFFNCLTWRALKEQILKGLIFPREIKYETWTLACGSNWVYKNFVLHHLFGLVPFAFCILWPYRKSFSSRYCYQAESHNLASYRSNMFFGKSVYLEWLIRPIGRS